MFAVEGFYFLKEMTVWFRGPIGPVPTSQVPCWGISQMQKPVCNLLTVAKELIKSSPSEDQRNQLCTSAEIFAGVLRAILLIQSQERDENTLWQIIFDYLDEAISKVPP